MYVDEILEVKGEEKWEVLYQHFENNLKDCYDQFHDHKMFDKDLLNLVLFFQL